MGRCSRACEPGTETTPCSRRREHRGRSHRGGLRRPQPGATLLNFCDLGTDEIPWTADRSPAKQGRFLPGAATAVISPEEFAARRPDLVVVLVWPLRTEVLAQFDDLRRAGTRFLFPLPEPELVG